MERQEVAIAWIYCTFKARDFQTTANLLGSLAAQLAQHRADLLQSVLQLYKRLNKERSVSQGDCMLLLANAVQKYRKVFVIIDGFDECSSKEDTWRKLLTELRTLTPSLNFLVTSRPIANIERECMLAAQVDIVAHNADVLEYIRAGLRKAQFQKYLSNDDDLKSDIENTLLRKSRGM